MGKTFSASGGGLGYPTYSEQAYVKIWDLIVKGDLTSDEILSVDDLVTKTAMHSKGPVREASFRLLSEGIFKRVMREGGGKGSKERLQLVSIRPETLVKVNEARMEFEAEAFKFFIKNADEEDVKEIKRLCGQFELVADDDGFERLEADRRFHTAFANIAGDYSLARLIGGLYDLSLLSISDIIYTKGDSVVQHREILKAVTDAIEYKNSLNLDPADKSYEETMKPKVEAAKATIMEHLENSNEAIMDKYGLSSKSFDSSPA